MALPSNYSGPSITSPRRYLWLAQRDRTRTGDVGPASAFRARRLATSATSLPATFPSRALLIAAGVLAVEEVVGAGVSELLSYGLSHREAERLALWLERLSMTTFNYGARAGQSYEEDPVTLLASSARTTSTTSDTVEVGDKGTLRLDLDITAVSGTAPQMHVQIETRKAYGSGTWRVVDAFEIASAVSSQRRAMSGCDRFVRAVCTLSGTSPSFTFSLTGEAV
jgi:hypothetical protein